MEKNQFIVRQATLDDVPGIRKVQLAAWGEAAATEEMYVARISRCPEGIFVAEHRSEGQIIAVVATYAIRGFDPDRPLPSWWEASGHGLCERYDRDGETMYGIDLAGDKEHSGSGAAAALVVRGMENVVTLGKKRVVLGCRLPDYHKHQDIPLAEYVRTRVVGGERRADATRDDVTPERRRGWRYLDSELEWFERRYCRGKTWTVWDPLPGYYEDPDSCNNAVLLVWENPTLPQ